MTHSVDDNNRGIIFTSLTPIFTNLLNGFDVSIILPFGRLPRRPNSKKIGYFTPIILWCHSTTRNLLYYLVSQTVNVFGSFIVKEGKRGVKEVFSGSIHLVKGFSGFIFAHFDVVFLILFLLTGHFQNN